VAANSDVIVAEHRDAGPALLSPGPGTGAHDEAATAESPAAPMAVQPNVEGAGPPAATQSPALAESPAEGGLPSAPEPRVVAIDTGPAAAVVLPPAAPVVSGAVLVLTPPKAPRPPAVVGRWDEPPARAAASTTGWAAAPVPAPTGRFSRAGRLVAASAS
jgi:hypothetical protein